MNIANRSLSSLKKNDVGIINKIDGSLLRLSGNFLAKDIEDSLLEIGFTEGSPIKIMHTGFWGVGAIAVRIGNDNRLISLRREEASAVMVECTKGF